MGFFFCLLLAYSCNSSFVALLYLRMLCYAVVMPVDVCSFALMLFVIVFFCS